MKPDFKDNKMEKSEKFEITYNSIGDGERREIESIRNRYAPHSDAEDKRIMIQRLDFLVRSLPIFISVAVCVIGLLVFGTGLAFVLKLKNIPVGVMLGVLGLAIMIIAYPVYKMLYLLNRKRYAGRIIALSDELLNSKGDDYRG